METNSIACSITAAGIGSASVSYTLTPAALTALWGALKEWGRAQPEQAKAFFDKAETLLNKVGAITK